MSKKKKLVLDEVLLGSDLDPKLLAPYLKSLEYTESSTFPKFHNHKSNLNNWLSPLKDEIFFKKYFGKSFYHFSSQDSERFTKYFSFDAFKKLMTSEFLQADDLRVFNRKGESMAKTDYTNNQKKIDTQQLLKIFFRDRGSI
ncbi:MAG: hypothetical protein ACK5V3_02625, partial [Bdellovibrionales bacterium]